MVATETITINVPIGMSRYLVTGDPESELRRNALLLYPYIYIIKQYHMEERQKFWESASLT